MVVYTALIRFYRKRATVVRARIIYLHFVHLLTKPVSYTHLDVYKRQIYKSECLDEKSELYEMRIEYTKRKRGVTVRISE